MWNKATSYNVQPPSSADSFTVDHSERAIAVKNTTGQWDSSFEIMESTLKLQTRVSGADSPYFLLAAAECLFAKYKTIDTLRFAKNDVADKAYGEFLKSGVDGSELRRSSFYRIPDLWHRCVHASRGEEEWTTTGSTRHPLRAPRADGVYYRRYSPAVGKTISFRAVDIAADLEDFHQWHNQPRVYDLWELNKPKEELKTYLEKGLSDPHQIPMILEIDGERVGYFEFYWAAEDRIAPFCDAGPYDRGFHLLIGNEKHLGRENTAESLTAATHFIFLEHARTPRVVAEPRADNKRVIKFIEIVPGWSFVKEFDFPHKRAALIVCDRDLFFEGWIP